MMKSSPAIAIITSLIFCFYSCSQTKEGTIVGKWQFDRTEKYGPDTDQLEAKNTIEQNRGVTAVFGKDGSYYTIRQTGDASDTIQKGKYEISKDGKQVITSHPYGADTVRLLELTSKLMRLETPQKDTVLLKKID